MNINQEGLDIIKAFEGFRAAPYLCSADVPTIGYGSTYYEDGTRVTLNDEPINEERAEKLLRHGVADAERAINALVHVPLTENQFSALCSFIYNVGSGAFQRSTMRMKLNRGEYDGAANEFWKWRRGGGVILNGLVRRRAAEESLFRA